jgi:hypothetical protein
VTRLLVLFSFFTFTLFDFALPSLLFDFSNPLQRGRIAIAITPAAASRANEFRLSLLLDDRGRV